MIYPTRAGVVMGTVGDMAPEQAAGAVVDAKSASFRKPSGYAGWFNDEEASASRRKRRRANAIRRQRSRHRLGRSFISRCSHALASRQSRMTVSADTSSTAAVSSTLRPPK